MRFSRPLAALLLGATIAAPACAKDIVVQMKNKGAAGLMVFEPAFVQAAQGDRIRFVPTDLAHNAEPIPGMLPAGVVAGAGAMNKEYVLTLTKPGLYGIKCKPHFGMGMIALIKAGTKPAPNAAVVRTAAATMPPLAKKRMEPLLASAK